jgi:TPR repeat protein
MKPFPRNPDDDAARVAAEAVEEAAHQAWDIGDLRAAFDGFRAGAALGWCGCMINLGYFHDEGLGTLRSMDEAMRWYRKAFESGDVVAATNIAILFRERDNPRRMFHWLRRGALRGDGDAHVNLAQCYRDGAGVPRSTARAVACARKALRSRWISPAGIEDARRVLSSV